MMHIESSILLKNHISCDFMLKYYITVLRRQLDQNIIQGNKQKEFFITSASNKRKKENKTK